MKRRELFGFLAAAASAPVLSLIPEQDDTARLQAMLDAGRPIPPGTYRISQLIVRRAGNVIRNCHFQVAHQEGWGGIYVESDSSDIVIEGNMITRPLGRFHCFLEGT